MSAHMKDMERDHRSLISLGKRESDFHKAASMACRQKQHKQTSASPPKTADLKKDTSEGGLGIAISTNEIGVIRSRSDDDSVIPASNKKARLSCSQLHKDSSLKKSDGLDVLASVALKNKKKSRRKTNDSTKNQVTLADIEALRSKLISSLRSHNQNKLSLTVPNGSMNDMMDKCTKESQKENDQHEINLENENDKENFACENKMSTNETQESKDFAKSGELQPSDNTGFPFKNCSGAFELILHRINELENAHAKMNEEVGSIRKLADSVHESMFYIVKHWAASVKQVGETLKQQDQFMQEQKMKITGLTETVSNLYSEKNKSPNSQISRDPEQAHVEELKAEMSRMSSCLEGLHFALNISNARQQLLEDAFVTKNGVKRNCGYVSEKFGVEDLFQLMRHTQK